MKIANKKLTLLSIMLISATGCATVSTAGEAVTNTAGMTLYTFDKDAKGVSNCYDACAVKWPPYTAASDAEVGEGWGMIERKDGSMQWTYKDQPLYTWIGDTAAGDTNGDGVGGVWHVAGQKAKKSAGSYSSGY